MDFDESRRLQEVLRPRDTSREEGIRPCDRCRRLRSKCSREETCQHCRRVGVECTRDDRLLKTGRLSKVEKERFQAAGISYLTFRDRLRKKKEQQKGGSRATTPSKGKAATTAGAAVACQSQEVPRAARSKETLTFRKRAQEEQSDLTALDLFNLLSPDDPATEGDVALASFILQQTRYSPASDSDTSGTSFSTASPVFSTTSIGSSVALQSRRPTIQPPTADDIHASAIHSFSASELPTLEQVTNPTIVWPAKSFLSIQLPEWLKGGDVAMERGWNNLAAIDPAADQLEFRLSPTGTIEVVPAGSTDLEGQRAFMSDWATTGPRSERVQPPWDLLASGNLEIAKLWPSGLKYTEDDFDRLRHLAAGILRHPAIPFLFESGYQMHGAIGQGFSPHFAHQLLAAKQLGSSGLSKLQLRHTQAFFLVTCGQTSRWMDIPLEFGGGQIVMAKARLFGFEMVKLGWALLLPCAGEHSNEEFSTELMAATLNLKIPMNDHPRAHMIRCAVLNMTAKPSRHDYLVRKFMLDAVEMLKYKRFLHDALLNSTEVRLWTDLSFPHRFRHMIEPLGPLDYLSEELITSGQGGLNTEDFLEYTRAANLLRIVAEELLDSSLMHPLAPYGTAQRVEQISMRESEGEAIYEELASWLHTQFRRYLVNPGCTDEHRLAVVTKQRQLAGLFLTLLHLLVCSLAECDGTFVPAGSQDLVKAVDTPDEAILHMQRGQHSQKFYDHWRNVWIGKRSYEDGPSFVRSPH